MPARPTTPTSGNRGRGRVRRSRSDRMVPARRSGGGPGKVAARAGRAGPPDPPAGRVELPPLGHAPRREGAAPVREAGGLAGAGEAEAPLSAGLEVEAAVVPGARLGRGD